MDGGVDMSKEKWGKVLLIGDTMVDVYIDVDIRGISPEAICLDVLPTLSRETYLGGAGNIYRQLVKMETPCALVTATGRHSSLLNEDFGQVYNSFDTKTYPIIRSIIDRKLTTKIRFMCNDQQIFRVSDEDSEYIDFKDIEPLLAIIENIIGEYDMVLLVDYNKGMMLPGLIQQVIKVAHAKHVPVIADIKPLNARYYNGSLVIKCNHKEYQKVDYRPNADYWVVTHGKEPTEVISVGFKEKFGTMTNHFYKNANCAGDIFMAGFVNSLVNNDSLGESLNDIICEAVIAGNKLAFQSLSQVKDKVVG